MKPGWRAWLAGAVFVALVIGGMLMTRRPESPAPVETTTAPALPATKSVALPQPPPALGRADLIDAANLAASSFAAGQPLPNTVLAGRRFTLNLPFGCDGPAADLSEQPSGWTLDEEQRTLRVKVTPEVLTASPLLAAVAGGATIEAAEGFWIDRPWNRTEACATASAQSNGTIPDRQSLIVVQLSEPGAQRSRTRDRRAYQAVQSIEEGVDLGGGLRLRIEGRLAALGERPPIGCWSESMLQRPTCVIGTRFERVAITDASGTRVFAKWTD